MQQVHVFCCSLTSKYTQHSLLVSFLPLKVSVIPFSPSFSLQKRTPKLSPSIFRSKNNTGTLVGADLLLDFLFLVFVSIFITKCSYLNLFCCSLNSKYTMHRLLVTFLSLKTLVISFSFSFSFQRGKSSVSFFFNKSKSISWNLLYAFEHPQHKFFLCWLLVINHNFLNYGRFRDFSTLTTCAVPCSLLYSI